MNFLLCSLECELRRREALAQLADSDDVDNQKLLELVDQAYPMSIRYLHKKILTRESMYLPSKANVYDKEIDRLTGQFLTNCINLFSCVVFLLKNRPVAQPLVKNAYLSQKYSQNW